MSIDTRNTSYAQTFRLKKVGYFLISLWVIVLVAGVASTIYREFDGPTVRSVTAQNMNLGSINSTLSTNLDLANDATQTVMTELVVATEEIARLNANLENSRNEVTALKRWYESRATSIPLSADAAAAAPWLSMELLP